MRFALGLDHDLAPFQSASSATRCSAARSARRPWLRPRRTADPFQALAWAVSEQLIEVERAFAIQRRILVALRPRDVLRDARATRRRPHAMPRRAPAELEACELAAEAARSRSWCAREVASGPRRPRPPRRPRERLAPDPRGSAPGRSRSSPSTARAATTSCPQATSPTSSSSAGSRGSAAARPWTRCASSSRPTRRSRGSRASTSRPGARVGHSAALGPHGSCLGRSPYPDGPSPGRNSLVNAPSRSSASLRGGFAHPADEGGPLARSM